MDCYFFGTFNPIHKGHIEIARQVKEKMRFDRIIFVPCFMPPHKKNDLASFKDRFNMVRLAVGENSVSDIEFKLKVPSYTYRTIEYLYKCEKINFIIGYDQFFKLESWKEPDKLKEMVNFIVIPRKFQNGQVMSKKALEYFKNKGYSFNLVDINFLDISSNMIRTCIENNEDITGLTTKEVKEYIERNRLYKKLVEEKFIRKKI